MEVAPREGFEPPTERLTAASSTTELPGNTSEVVVFPRRSRTGRVARAGYIKARLPLPELSKRPLKTPDPVCLGNGGRRRNRTAGAGFAVPSIATLLSGPNRNVPELPGERPIRVRRALGQAARYAQTREIRPRRAALTTGRRSQFGESSRGNGAMITTYLKWDFS